MPITPNILATDLDGTLIPLDGEPDHHDALATLTLEFQHAHRKLTYVTGRHFGSIKTAMAFYDLPAPEWIICDMGTTILQSDHSHPDRFRRMQAYHDQLSSLIIPLPQAELRQQLREFPELRIQEESKQGPFKLSYYTSAETIEETAEKIEDYLSQSGAPYSLIHSVDPFNHDGLIDFLPKDVSKAYAILWWIEHHDGDAEEVVFAGDSGNDRAVFESGIRSIIVGNADRRLASKMQAYHDTRGWKNRLYLAEQSATQGVLEGCRWFGLISPESSLQS